ncbi:uncharacterized protein TA14870 [Theileria annulata]|uniref:Uncharacterized protein n=1 Tax=Theileria annulata TaxID=5874 RepID=Q4UF98_THEAN|nr:uncharacterized protein TA14870 [Theileria annulata]CAI74241.1 hypothetical protein TA14870 [Theileria annulata]|eukprot:XP_951973.1 hypothetical protein TA14870 [Theileria annulata]
MGVETQEKFNIDFIKKFIGPNNKENTKQNTKNNEQNGLISGADDLKFDDLKLDYDSNDLSTLESKVDVYLSKIKELDTSLNEDDNKYEALNEKVREFVSIEKLHRCGSDNRHIYFAGIPLSHSLEVLKGLRIQKEQQERINQLESKVNDLNDEITELNEEKQLHFYKFEKSIHKALNMGLAIQNMLLFFDRYDKVRMKIFILKLRAGNYQSIKLNLRRLEKYKITAFTNSINKIMKFKLKYYINLLKAKEPFEKPKYKFEPAKLKKTPRVKTPKVDPDVNVGVDVETNLLNRLEKLLVQEINTLM